MNGAKGAKVAAAEKITAAQRLILDAMAAGATLVFHGNLNRGYVRGTNITLTRSAWRKLIEAGLIAERDNNGYDSPTGYYLLTAKYRSMIP